MINKLECTQFQSKRPELLHHIEQLNNPDGNREENCGYILLEMKAEAQVCWRKLGQPHLLQGGLGLNPTHICTQQREERENRKKALSKEHLSLLSMPEWSFVSFGSIPRKKMLTICYCKEMQIK